MLSLRWSTHVEEMSEEIVLKEKPVGKALVAELFEEACHRRGRRSRKRAQEAWFE
ncbi:hypothetical protein Goshw_001262 [Gossypium schwendimanii]|uniref:Uncharacterized protein n=1 Tax=Gossypium schwendimanii TaxID=34291 RepID=A0A7J9NBN7_GOSSC|nr:hypothetical protein [Gossypium schwendimanii]